MRAVMHKISNIIFAVLRDQKPFELRFPQDHAQRLAQRAGIRRGREKQICFFLSKGGSGIAAEDLAGCLPEPGRAAAPSSGKAVRFYERLPCCFLLCGH